MSGNIYPEQTPWSGSAQFQKAPPSDPHEALSPAELEEVFRFLGAWLGAAREYVAGKTAGWKLLEDLYHNRLDLRSWGEKYASVPGPSDDAPGLFSNWQSDIIVSPSYIVDSWADRAYQAVFNGPEWLSVTPESPEIGPGSPEQVFPLSFKLQELLIRRLECGQIHARLYEILHSLVLYGTAYAKIYWKSGKSRLRRWNLESPDLVTEDFSSHDCPVVQIIPLDRMLLDWRATSSDVQRSSGIGHTVDKTFQSVLDGYESGLYNLNRDVFMERFRQASSTSDSAPERLMNDPDTWGLSDEFIRHVTVWEFHGQIPYRGSYHECVCSVVTEHDSDSPETGLLIRFTPRPALWSGMRPFLCAHYTPMPGPLGVGAVESNLDLIHSISQFLSQSQDNARLTANAQLIVRRGSAAARQIGLEDDTVYPGKVWLVDDPADIQPFPKLNFPQTDINTLINYLNTLLERRTAVSDISLGVSGRGKTATEAHILQQSAMAPFETRADLFARSFIEPMGQLALDMIRQFTIEDQIIVSRDYSGKEIPLTITAAELHSGQYRVYATLTSQDSTRLAKAQSIERALPTLASFQERLEMEGVRISFSELIKRYLDLIGVDGTERILSRTGPTDSGINQEFSSEPLVDDRSRGYPGISGRSAPRPLVENGGPMGDYPDEINALAQLLQVNASNLNSANSFY
mgnify:CR=1 FL=1